VCQQTFPRQTTAADAPIADTARMLAAAVAPRTALLINRILIAPIVPPVQATNGDIRFFVPESMGPAREFRRAELGTQIKRHAGTCAGAVLFQFSSGNAPYSE
jgi:hypothetical protein